MNKLKVAFFGTPDITIPSLELLNDRNDIELHTIVTMPDRPAGRGNNLKSPIVAEFAKKHNINLIQSNNINKDIDKRKIIMKQLNRDEALEAFRIWQNKEDKIKY